MKTPDEAIKEIKEREKTKLEVFCFSCGEKAEWHKKLFGQDVGLCKNCNELLQKKFEEGKITLIKNADFWTIEK